jgi:hypothetical protein
MGMGGGFGGAFGGGMPMGMIFASYVALGTGTRLVTQAATEVEEAEADTIRTVVADDPGLPVRSTHDMIRKQSQYSCKFVDCDIDNSTLPSFENIKDCTVTLI